VAAAVRLQVARVVQQVAEMETPQQVQRLERQTQAAVVAAATVPAARLAVLVLSLFVFAQRNQSTIR
jgi:hypothetical protein